MLIQDVLIAAYHVNGGFMIKNLDAGAVGGVAIRGCSCLVCCIDDLHLCEAKPLASFWLMCSLVPPVCLISVSLLVGELFGHSVTCGRSTNWLRMKSRAVLLLWCVVENLEVSTRVILASYMYMNLQN